MGYNSVVVVMNDAIGMIEKDQTFGKNLHDAVITMGRPDAQKYGNDVPAYSPTGLGVFCNAATVVSSQHADVPQVVVVKHNSGYVYKYGETLPDHVLEDLKWVLAQHGYTTRKKPTKKEVK